MSRRSRRSRQAGEAAGAEAGRAKQDAGRPARGARGAGRPPRRAGAPESGSGIAPRSRSGWGLGVQVAFLAAVFGIVVLVAELAGAANLGVALGIGQIAFAIAAGYVLMRR